MTNHHFISYSTVDAYDFALELCDKLNAGPPPISAWLDKRELKPGPHWDDQIVEAIRSCESLLKFFDLIAESDKRGLLAGLREAAAGTEK